MNSIQRKGERDFGEEESVSNVPKERERESTIVLDYVLKYLCIRINSQTLGNFANSTSKARLKSISHKTDLMFSYKCPMSRNSGVPREQVGNNYRTEV